MTTKQAEFVFDKNEFVKEISNNSLMGEYINRVIRAMSDPNSRDRDGNIYGYNGPTTDEELEKTTKLNPDRAYITKSLYEMYKHPESQAAQDIKACWQFIGPVFSGKPTEQEVLLILKKIDIFDEHVQIELLRHIQNILEDHNQNISPEKAREISRNIAIKISANQFATLSDMSNAAVETNGINLVRDTVEMAKRELNKELGKDFPDRQKVSDICYYARKAVGNLPVEQHKYKEDILSEFDTDKILAFGPTYVPKLQKSLEERAVEAEYAQFKANTELDKKREEIESMKRDKAFIEENLEKEKQKNDMLVKQLNEMQSKLREQETIIKSIKMKIASQKVGLIGGGPLKEIQEYVANATKQYNG